MRWVDAERVLLCLPLFAPCRVAAEWVLPRLDHKRFKGVCFFDTWSRQWVCQLSAFLCGNSISCCLCVCPYMAGDGSQSLCALGK